MVLVDVVQNLNVLWLVNSYFHLVIKRNEVLNLRLWDATLWGSDVCQSMTDLEGGRKFTSRYGEEEEKWKLTTTKYGITSIQPCLFSTLWKSWKTLSCNEVTTKLRMLDLNIGHEDSLLWSRVAFPPADGFSHYLVSVLTCRLPGRQAWRRLEECSCPLHWQPRATENFKLIPGRRFQLRTW